MDNLTAQSVEEVFGIDFKQYCLSHKILIKKDKYGAFLVPNILILAECIDVLDGFKHQTNRKLKNLQKQSLPRNCSSYKYYIPRSEKQRKKKKRIQFHEGTINRNVFLIHIDLNVCLYNTSSRLSSYKSSIPNCALNTKNGNEIYDHIIKETIKDVIITDYEYSIPLISPLLEEFKKKHKKFHYYDVLKHLMQGQKPDKDSKCKYAINKKQLKLFFNLIFGKVVPLAIFGKLNNLKKIRKAMFCLLDTSCFDSFNLKPIIESLDIFSIKWLRDIGSAKTKWLIITKFIKWFFVEFLLKILHATCHVTSGTTNERLYILRKMWNRIQKQFIKKGKLSNLLQPDIKRKGWYPPIGTYKLVPKVSGVRPIFRPQYQITDKNQLYVILKFLKQLYVTKYGISTFQDKWKSIVQHKYNSEGIDSYIVRCDVVNAFGSIIQEQLYNIIQTLCKDLPETLVLKHYAVKSEIFKEDIVCYKQYFSDPSLQLPFTPGTLYTYPFSNYCQWIKKSWLLHKISKHIFCQRVQIGQKTHIIGHGIVQGAMLSPILSDIYYNFILNKEMSTYLKAGEVIKYMDDILYVTENECFAKQFLQLIKKGIPEYNCYFKQSKTQSNVTYAGNRAVNNIIYIGYKINCNTLEVIVKRPNTALRYLISLSNKKNLSPIQFLSNRLNNLGCFRLSKFILDNTINSNKTITKVISDLSLLQAKRASLLIKLLFDDVKMNLGRILNVIKNSNEKIARHVIKMFLMNEKKTDESQILTWNDKIMWTLWTSYRKVLMKDQLLQQYFITVF